MSVLNTVFSRDGRRLFTGGGEKGKIIGYANSKDLVHWSEQRAIGLMENEPATRNIWAPEISYERPQNRWLVFWSSTVPGKFPDTDQTGDEGYNHRF